MAGLVLDICIVMILINAVIPIWLFSESAPFIEEQHCTITQTWKGPDIYTVYILNNYLACFTFIHICNHILIIRIYSSRKYTESPNCLIFWNSSQKHTKTEMVKLGSCFLHKGYCCQVLFKCRILCLGLDVLGLNINVVYKLRV